MREKICCFVIIQQQTADRNFCHRRSALETSDATIALAIKARSAMIERDENSERFVVDSQAPILLQACTDLGQKPLSIVIITKRTFYHQSRSTIII